MQCIMHFPSYLAYIDKVTFVTGDERGAETDANIHATLIGTSSELVVPIDNDRVSIQRNAEEIITFHTDSHSIGTIRGVRVGHDAEGTGSGWFLEKIILNISVTPDDSSLLNACSILDNGDDLCMATRDDNRSSIVFEFPFYGWLGKSDSGGHDGPLCVELSPLPIGQWPGRECVTPEELRDVLEEAASHPVALRLAGYCIPHPEKVTEGMRAFCGKNFGHGGEDSYFCHPLGFLGVADGVYAWRAKGVDSGLYSQSLMRGALERAIKGGLDAEALTPMDLFNAAVDSANRSESKGSSTTCIFGLVPMSLLINTESIPHKNFNNSIHKGGSIGQCVNLGW
jgi:hypothetical protein